MKKILNDSIVGKIHTNKELIINTSFMQKRKIVLRLQKEYI